MAIEGLAKKIQHERKRNGLSQEALALQLGLRRQSVSRWESGEGYPELETLLELSKCLGVTIDYLLNDELPVGYQNSLETVTTAISPSAQVVSGDRKTVVAGILVIMLGALGVMLLWVQSILEPAPVMGPELGFIRAYRHYLDYNELTPLFGAAAMLILLGCALLSWDVIRRRAGGRKAVRISPAIGGEARQEDV